MQGIRHAVWLLLLCRILLLHRAPSSMPSPAVAAADQSETVALLHLRADLGIRKVYWPRGSDPCSTWNGIECDQGHTVGIELAGLRRTARRSLQPSFSLDALQQLPFLRSLNASGFPLPGAIPDWFGRLSNLQVLDLTAAFVNGTIPSSLAGLSNLKILSLANNSLTGGIPSVVSELMSLTSLDLASNALSGSIPVSITNLRNLTLLDLSGNNLAGSVPVSIGNLAKLQSLMLASNSLSGSIPNHVSDLLLLNEIDLSSNSLSGPIPVNIGRLAILKSLNLSNNSLNGSIPADITNCTQLQVLSLDHNNLSGTLPATLGLLKKLSNLDLSFNNLTGILPLGVSTLFEAMKITLSHNLFYGPLPLGTASLPKLVILDVSYNYLNGSLSGNRTIVVRLEENCFSGAAQQHTFADCESFYALNGISFHGTIGAAVASLTSGINHKKNKHLKIILGGSFGGFGFVLILILVVVFILKQERRTEAAGRENGAASQKDAPQLVSGSFLRLGEPFTYSQLEQSTDNFSAANLLKDGHSGSLYQGLLEGGVSIVVKVIDQSSSKDAYLTELGFFESASHTRLVPLLGQCLEREDQKLLVYKYMPNRDLFYALYRRANTNPADNTLQSLDWITRLKIAIGAAEGLAYLHHECTPPFAHRDIQASSILLDDKFEVRLGSLAEACISEAEAHHRVIARIFRKSQMSEQSDPRPSAATCSNDVYCFGKVLLELVTGKLGISGSADPGTDVWLEWALALINIYDKEFLSKLIDPSLVVDEDLLEEVWAMAIVAKSCLNPKPSKRPLMKHILKALENPLKVVREDTFNGSGRARTSSNISWNAALFGSWRHSSSETVAIPGSLREEYTLRSSSKRLGIGGSQDSGQGDISHRRLGSSEIYPEPVEESVFQVPNHSEQQVS